MRILRFSAAYFVVVFGAGFAMGIVRTQWMVPRWGARTSELCEMPFMLVAIILGARWISGCIGSEGGAPMRRGVGMFALGLLLTAELGLGVAIRKVSISEVVFDRDPVSGFAYCALLIVFAIMPWFHWRYLRHGPS